MNDFDEVPPILLFPNLAKVVERLTCREKSFKEEFRDTKLTSILRIESEEATFDQYLANHQIEIAKPEKKEKIMERPVRFVQNLNESDSEESPDEEIEIIDR